MKVHCRSDLSDMALNPLSCGWSLGYHLADGLGNKLEIVVPQALAVDRQIPSLRHLLSLCLFLFTQAHMVVV